MKDKKTELKFFTIAAWDKEQEYLRRMHHAGWRLERVGFYNLYHFVRCEPEDVVYQLDYGPEGAAEKDAYVRMFTDCGWEYIQDYAGYSYFRKPVAEMDGHDEEIFCDDESRLELLRRVFVGRMVPALVIVLLLVVPYVVPALGEPSAYSMVLLALFLVMLGIYCYIFVQFVVRYLRLAHKR